MMQHFGRYIRELRLSKGNTSQDLAAYLDIAPALIDKIEKGRVNVTKNQVFKLAGYFGADERNLLIRYQKDRILSEIKADRVSERISRTGNRGSGLINSTAAASKRYRNMMHELLQLRKNPLQVKLHKPSHPLSLYVESILYCKGHHLDYAFEKILPDGVVQLIIELDGQERLLMSGNGERSFKNAWVTGLQKRHLTYRLKQSEAALYIRFHPGGLYALTRIPQSALENAAVAADLLLGPSILRLREILLHCTDVHEILQRTAQYLFTKISQSCAVHPVIAYMCRYIETPISLLTLKTGYTQKHLIHLFKKHVGVTPKYFQRICRFSNALNDIQTTTGSVHWPAIALDNHYYDQAHFIKEFSHFAGISPQSYLEAGSTCSKFIHTNTSR